MLLWTACIASGIQATVGQALVIQVQVFGCLAVQIQDSGRSCLVAGDYIVLTAWKCLATKRACATGAWLRKNEFRFRFPGAWPQGAGCMSRAWPKVRYRHPNTSVLHLSSLAQPYAGNQTRPYILMHGQTTKKHHCWFACTRPSSATTHCSLSFEF